MFIILLILLVLYFRLHFLSHLGLDINININLLALIIHFAGEEWIYNSSINLYKIVNNIYKEAEIIISIVEARSTGGIPIRIRRDESEVTNNTSYILINDYY